MEPKSQKDKVKFKKMSLAKALKVEPIGSSYSTIGKKWVNYFDYIVFVFV